MAKDLSVYYTYDSETKKYIGANQSQIDPLESKKAGKTVYCGLPQNATYDKPLEPKDGFDVVWNGSTWEYKEIPQPEPAPEPTIDEKKAAVRRVRDIYINGIEWRVSRYRDQIELEIPTTDDEKTYIKILQYMQYLRDYPESSETWYEQNPMTWDEWNEAE